ncbi:MAG: tyrosine-type recombinase/integrase [Fibromonadaceae bacterium]|jgi:integrase|nr:tyrosine-type recombinase/integrase [Fibromonadaceae bacterium]
MASVNKFIDRGFERVRLTDTSFGYRVQYNVNLYKNTAKQWLNAHNAIMQSLSPEQRRKLSNKQIKELAANWLAAPKGAREQVKAVGLTVVPATSYEMSFAEVAEKYLADFCRPGINSETAIIKAKRQCGILLEFLRLHRITEYNKLSRDIMAQYPEWRSSNRQDGRSGVASADVINKELYRMAAIIKHGVKYHGWTERYLLDGIKVKATAENTKSVRPFEIAEAKTILEWLRDNALDTGNWHLHDMVLLALCTGLEAKALHLLVRDWFKMDLGVLRVYDKFVSGVLDAKTQNRARDIPLTPTLRKIYERGFIFVRHTRTRRLSLKGETAFAAWAESILRKAEMETGIADINLHRFRHTCATARLSAGWQLIRVSRMLGHSNINTTASHYAEYDLSASPEGFEGMVAVYKEFTDWLDEGYFR